MTNLRFASAVIAGIAIGAAFGICIAIENPNSQVTVTSQIEQPVMDSLHVPGCERGYTKDHVPCD